MTLGGFLIVLPFAGVAGGLAVVGPRLLLRWYLREVRRLEIAEDRGEAIVTYPFA